MSTHRHSRKYHRQSPSDPKNKTNEYHKLQPSRAPATHVQSEASYEYSNVSKKKTKRYRKLQPSRAPATRVQSELSCEYSNNNLLLASMPAAAAKEPRATVSTASSGPTQALPRKNTSRRPTKCFLRQTELLNHDGHRSDPARDAGTISTAGFYASVTLGTAAGPSGWYGDDEPIWVEIVNGVCIDIPPSRARTRASGLYGGAGSVGAQANTKTSKRKWFKQRSQRTTQSSRPQLTKSG